MIDLRIDSDRTTRLEVRGRLLYCIRTSKWWGIEVIVAPLDRVKLRGSGVETFTSAFVLIGFAAAILASGLSLWFLHASYVMHLLVAGTLILMGVKAGLRRMVSCVLSWWRGERWVHLYLTPYTTHGQVHAAYREGSSAAFDAVVEQIRRYQDSDFASSPSVVRFAYYTPFAESVRFLSNLVIPVCILIPIAVGDWGNYFLNLLIAVMAPLYLIGTLLLLWCFFARRKLKVAEAALFDGDYDTAALVLSGLPEPASQGIHATHLAAMLALLRGDLNVMADSLAVMQRAKAFFFGVVVFSSSLFFPQFSVTPPKAVHDQILGGI